MCWFIFPANFSSLMLRVRVCVCVCVVRVCVGMGLFVCVVCAGVRVCGAFVCVFVSV